MLLQLILPSTLESRLFLHRDKMSYSRLLIEELDLGLKRSIHELCPMLLPHPWQLSSPEAESGVGDTKLTWRKTATEAW